VFSSLIYASVHFFQKPAPPEGMTWWRGLESLGAMLAGWADPGLMLPGLLVLFMAGWILALCYQRTGSLCLSIGIHAGWVFWLRFFGMATHRDPGGTTAFWGTSRLYDGWLSCIMMATVLAGILVWLPKPDDDVPNMRPDGPSKMLA
jgi:membrane protease YdiL (CAAX protease family)